MISLLITGIVVLVLLSAVMAPIESLGWWAGWFGEKKAPPSAHDAIAEDGEFVVPQANHYLVYLSGIGAITDDSIPDEEIKWLAVLKERMPGTDLVTDVFPYSVTNAGLTNQHAFAWLWRRVEALRLKNPMAISALLVNLRNVLQVAVSADPRYGPIYNYGVAQEIVRALHAHGYRIGDGVPVTMLGWSGGGQISLGTSTFLKGMLEAPIRVVSVGGVMADDPGLKMIENLDHYYGDKDPVQGLGGKIYFGRWKMAVNSAWNLALAKGKITMTSLGPLVHMGKGNYFDFDTKDEKEISYAEKTIEAVTGSLVKFGVLVPVAASVGQSVAVPAASLDAPVSATPDIAMADNAAQDSPTPDSLPDKSE